MIVKDPLYGTAKVEGVLAELITSSPVQRLKSIRQAGAPAFFRPEWHVSRYDHSIGVMLLVRRLGGSLREQTAALLHDVAHTALSHFVDVVYEREEEDYHEQIIRELVGKTEVPAILRAHGLDPDEILKVTKEAFPRLEQPLPALCADRIDYTLRDQHLYYGVPAEQIAGFLNSLAADRSGKVYVKEVRQAEWFTNLFYDEVAGFFMEPFNIYANQLLKPAVLAAMKAGVIEEKDWLGSDRMFMEKLRQFPTARQAMEVLAAPPALEKCPVREADFVHRVKPRMIDPDVLYDGGIVPITTVSEKAQLLNKVAADRFVQGVKVLGESGK
jgi:uncharacterized protein